LTVWKRGCERIFLKTAPVANDRAALTVGGRFSGAPISEVGNFASAPSGPYTGKPSVSFASGVCAECGRLRAHCFTGARRVMWIVRLMKSSVASLPRMLASLAALGLMKYEAV